MCKNGHVYRLGSIINMNRRYTCSLSYPSSIPGIILPHLSLVVHSTYAVEFYGTLQQYRRIARTDFQFFTCAKTFSTGTRLLECALICAFLVAVSRAPLGFLCGTFAWYPKKIVLYSHISPVQIQAYAVVRWYALSIYHAICPFAKVWQPLGQYSQVMAASLPGINSNDVI